MAFLGIFGNYNKPGPGVNKDDPKKAAPIRFFEVLIRKFTKLVQLNLIFLLPVLGVSALMIGLFLVPWRLNLVVPVGSQGFALDLWAMYVVTLPLVLLSPFMAGLTLVTRNFAREEHAFVWSDFWAAVKSNWKYFLLNGCLCYGLYVILSFAMTYYFYGIAEQGFYFVLFVICTIFAVVFIFAQFYLPIMFVTFELKFKQAYKNAFIFALAGLWRNVLIAVILGALIYAILQVDLLPLVILVLMVLVLFLLFSLISYFVNFTIYPVIDSYLIQPYQQRQEDAIAVKTPAASDSDSPLFPGAADLEEDGEEDKFVYVNGRLIKKSELKDSK